MCRNFNVMLCIYTSAVPFCFPEINCMIVELIGWGISEKCIKAELLFHETDIQSRHLVPALNVRVDQTFYITACPIACLGIDEGTRL